MTLIRNRHFAALVSLVSLITLASLLVMTGCNPEEKGPTAEKFIESRNMMGTWATLTIITGGGKQAVRAMDAAYAALDSVNLQMSAYLPGTEIGRINAGETAEVSEATQRVLEEAFRYTDLSGGAFDVTVGPLIQLWREAAKNDRLPSAAEIATAMALVGPGKIEMEGANRTVRLRFDGMRLDLGGIAKGYGIDRAAAALQREGVNAGIVEVGGDLYCFGEIPAELIGKQPTLPVRALRRKTSPAAIASKPGNSSESTFAGIRRTESKPLVDLKPWPLGLQSPFGEVLVGKIQMPGGAVATSGHYRRYSTVEGKQYSHIIDARSGWPVEAPASATVIAPDAMTADALATAITVLGAEAGLALAESIGDVEALVIEGTAEEPELLTTSGFPKIEPLSKRQ
jgi:FAD:protein FMN transferase